MLEYDAWFARHRPIPLTDPAILIIAQQIRHPRQRLRIDTGERVRGGEEGGAEEGGEGEDEIGDEGGGETDVDIGGDTKSISSGDSDDSSESSSSKDGDDDDDMLELEDVPAVEGGRGQVGDEDNLQVLRAWIQSLEEEVPRRDVEREAYHADYGALEAKRDHLQRERDEPV
ncbi:uncharacterized protein LOC131858428 [Cryptomeria japonica]|uniref:uncharacterized protein LOC131858428 n=1 Tax=Cryptomeria japonica TaxID=3369 RepID=UPI0027DA6433|nr:uncharacterized protein LOC131858428 [Cryptomeria japonica]